MAESPSAQNSFTIQLATEYSHHVVAANCLLNNTSTLLAPLPSHVNQVLLHRLLLEVLPAIANVWVSSAEGAGAAPAGLAEPYVRELVHVVWGNIPSAV